MMAIVPRVVCPTKIVGECSSLTSSFSYLLIVGLYLHDMRKKNTNFKYIILNMKKI
jgi:hypothetical protein